MRLFAAIVPPPEVLEELDSVVRSVVPRRRRAHVPRRPERPAAEGHHAAPRQGLLGRFTTRTAAPPIDPDTPHTDQLTRLITARMNVPITSFGSLTRGDTDRVAAALREAAASWVSPSLFLTGGSALEFPGDTSVWTGIGGDVDQLGAIAQEMPKLAQRLSLFVDRRTYRPLLPVGTITDTTTSPFLEELVAALTAFRSSTWTQDSVSLMSGEPNAGPDEPFVVLERMPVGVR